MSIHNLRQMFLTATSPFVQWTETGSTVWHSSHIWIADLTTTLAIDGQTRRVKYIVRQMPMCSQLLISSRNWPLVIPSTIVAQVRVAGFVALFIISSRLSVTRSMGSAIFWTDRTKVMSMDSPYSSTNSFIISIFHRSSISLASFVRNRDCLVSVSNSQR